MKHLKKLIVAALAVMTAVALCVPALAFAEDETITGTITIQTVDGQTYKLYKLFDATTVDGRTADQTDGITYTLIDGKTLPEDNAWFAADAQGYVTAKNDADITTDAFKTWAEGYGDLNDTVINGDDTEQSWTGLTEGYYYITTTTGSLVTVTSIKPDVTVEDKNTVPSIDKDITSVSSGGYIDDDGESAQAQIGDTVGYTVNISAYKGAENYVLTDTLSAGLTLVNTATTTEGVTTNSGIVIKQGSTTLTENTDYTVGISGQTITVTFAKAYLDTITGTPETPTAITVEYSAIINENAVIGEEGNPNNAQLSYGHDNESNITPADTPKVYVAQISIIKVKPGDTEGSTAALTGAGFKIYKLVGSAEKYFHFEDNAVSWVDTEAEGTEVLANGGDDQNVATFVGLENGTYYIVESTVPKGYNRIADGSKSFTIEENDYSNGNLIQTDSVLNQSGLELPSTGGIGTTVLYVVGGIMIVVAAVFLIRRRRANSGNKSDDLM